MAPLLESRNPLIRKGAAALYQVPRAVNRLAAGRDAYADNPPVLVNSIPKSGTHLLLQLARALPGTNYYGSFVAQRWSLTLHRKNAAEVMRKLRRCAPGEALGSHIEYESEVAGFLRDMQYVHLFIYRDPRDIVLSEANYLSHMAPWHRLHRVIRRVANEAERLEMLIEGVPGIYEDIGTRLRNYIGWLDDPAVISLRYEDLSNEKRSETINNLAEILCRRITRLRDPAMLSRVMVSAMAPERSHTFHQGGTEKWRQLMPRKHVARIEKIAGREIESLGYALSSQS